MAAVDLYLLWVVTSFIFGVVGAIAAQKLHRPPLVGFILGAALNAAVLLLLLSKKPGAQDNASVR